jgi:tetratricopeptide (TPR) repeat protein
MGWLRRFSSGSLTLAALVAAGSLALPARAADESLAQQLTDLDRLTGTGPVQGQLKELLKTPDHGKALVKYAWDQLKQHRTIPYNAALVLAHVAQAADNVNASAAFYRVCGQQAVKLESTDKIVQSYGSLIDLLYDQKRYKEAARVCREILELKAPTERPRVVLLAVTNREGEADFEELENYNSAALVRPAVHRILIQAIAKEGKFDEALKMVEHLIKSPTDWNALELKVDILLEAKKYADAAKVYEDILRGLSNDKELSPKKRDGLVNSMRRGLIQVTAKQGKYEQALKMVEELIKSPDDWKGHALKGEILRQAGKDAEAAKTYENILKRLHNNKDMKAEERDELVDTVRYILSNVYVDLKQIDKAAAELQRLAKKHPDDPGYQNDLGYIWADHDMHLAKAEKLIRHALELDRKRRQKNPEADQSENGAYLDSLGWVLFKQKKYKEAREVLEKAVKEKGGQHIEIFDHLGDACMALGERQAAIQAWRRGLEVAGSSRREQQRRAEVERKIEAAKGAASR